LNRPYGTEIAALLQHHAPTLLYEDGMTALPVDYRRCREDACAAGRGDGAVASTEDGQDVVAFTHVIDCRPGRPRDADAAGADCSGSRAGHLYLQYWFYYPGSATGEGSTPLRRAIRSLSSALGKPTFHPDDWESYQVRIDPSGRASARASSHHGHSYELAGGTVPGLRIDSRRGLRIRAAPRVRNGWGPEAGLLYVSGGSHAGSARVYRRVSRSTKDHRLRLVPIESIVGSDSARFAITPPWRKRVYRDPEYAGTD
jgi:hypothetical protein